MILSLDLGRLNGQQHFYCYFLVGFYVSALEDVGIFATADLMRNGKILQFSE
jgi:hypothetical protein